MAEGEDNIVKSKVKTGWKADQTVTLVNIDRDCLS